MLMQTFPSILCMAAVCCAGLAITQDQTCPKTGKFDDECGDLADLGFPLAGLLACFAVMLFFMSQMGFLGRSSMFGMGGYMGGYGI